MRRPSPNVGRLPIEEILAPDERDPGGGEVIGRSREGRPIHGYRLGRGAVRISLIGGCHADEPVGPAMLRRLCAWLGDRPADDPWLERLAWSIVPHANPDGEARNASWSRRRIAVHDHLGAADEGYDLAAYLDGVVREPPGDDVEFGFPRDAEDAGARPENRAVADFLSAAAPYVLHGSFHGMSFARGPWFLLEPAWIERTGELRAALRRRVREMGYALFDVDRGGEKGFHRIDEGFSTRPDSGAMTAHFEERGEPETAALFRPSSMELVRGFGGDPLTFVSEMPLFLLPPAERLPVVPVGTEGRLRFHAWLEELVARHGAAGARREAGRLGLEPMPIRDQMRLQLELLDRALAAAAGDHGRS